MTERAPSDIYLGMKDTINSLITEENQDVMVPACPEWSLRDLIGHLVGSLEDIHNDNLEGFASPGWTNAQVQRYADHDLAGVKRAWDELIVQMGEGFAAAAEAVLPDIAVHEQDVRGALGNTDGRDSPGLRAAEAFLMQHVCNSFRAKDVPPLRITYDDASYVIGGDEPQGELRTSCFEMSRVATGRRSATQIRSLDWSVDPAPWLEHISLFPPRETDLIE